MVGAGQNPAPRHGWLSPLKPHQLLKLGLGDVVLAVKLAEQAGFDQVMKLFLA